MEKKEIKKLMKELESIIKAYGEKTRKTNLIKLNENALKSYIRHFENKSIYFYMQGVISCRNTIHKAKLNYNENEHKLTIYDALREDTIIIELDMAYQILTNKKHTMLEIRTDNDEVIKLEL